MSVDNPHNFLAIMLQLKVIDVPTPVTFMLSTSPMVVNEPVEWVINILLITCKVNNKIRYKQSITHKNSVQNLFID